MYLHVHVVVMHYYMYMYYVHDLNQLVNLYIRTYVRTWVYVPYRTYIHPSVLLVLL